MSPASKPTADHTPTTCPKCHFSFVPGSTDGPRAADQDQSDATQTRVPRQPGSDPTSPPPPSSAEVPARLGRFEVKRFLGEGVFGRVYEAYDTSLKRIVALKVAKPEQMHSAERVKRFQREARAAATLAHPHVVGVFDAGQDGPHHYIATTFIPGRSLAAVLEDQPNQLPGVANLSGGGGAEARGTSRGTGSPRRQPRDRKPEARAEGRGRAAAA